MMILRWGKRIVIAFIALLLVYAVGRGIQLWIDDGFSGERPPYLQQAGKTAITLRWQTPVSVINRVEYGTSITNLDRHIEESRPGEEHEVRISGLSAGTRYFYRIMQGEQVLYAGEEYWFVTSADKNSTASRFLVLGDPGYAGERQHAVRDAVKQWLKANRREKLADLDFIVTTGDNAYRSGSNQQFQNGFFLPYADWFKNYPVWPVYGNHDARRFVFFDIFSFPIDGESGGVASGTENYYAFDHGDMHLVVLDTQSSDMDADATMLQWLHQDLASNSSKWLIVLLHHPPYTKGSHDSDDRGDSNGRLFEVREKLLPILEQAGVDLLLSGHSHMYERSYLLKCHYGSSDTLKEKMIVSKQAQSQYEKNQQDGTVYAVVGSSSKLDDGPLNHPAMAVSLHEAGALMVDVNGNMLSGRFINSEAKVSDSFTIRKTTTHKAASKLCEQGEM